MQGERDPLLLLPSANIITNLNGLLKEYASDLEEKSVDVVKCCRQNLSWFKCLVFFSLKVKDDCKHSI